MELPHLSINMAMTLDGKVVLPDGRWHGLSSREDRRRMGIFRKNADALIMGVNSIENDDPDPGISGDEKGPVPVIIARNSLPSIHKKVFRSKRAILYTRKEVIHKDLEIYRDACRLMIKSMEDLTPMKILQDLHAQGFNSVLLEGGPRLNYSFFRENLVSKINLTIVPFLIGQKNLSGIVNGEEAFLDFSSPHWELISSEKVANEVFLEYRRIE